MIQFSELNIEYTSKCFEGDKIRMERILNQEITVLDYKIEPSKISSYKEKGMENCLYLHILYKNEKRVIFTGGSALIEVIQKVSRESFPFATIIIEEKKRYKFT